MGPACPCPELDVQPHEPILTWDDRARPVVRVDHALAGEVGVREDVYYAPYEVCFEDRLSLFVRDEWGWECDYLFARPPSRCTFPCAPTNVRLYDIIYMSKTISSNNELGVYDLYLTLVFIIVKVLDFNLDAFASERDPHCKKERESSNTHPHRPSTRIPEILLVC